MSNVKSGGGYAAENARVQNDVKQYAKTLFDDLKAGNAAQTQTDVSKFQQAYQADGGKETGPGAFSELQEAQPGLSDADIATLTNIANENIDTK